MKSKFLDVVKTRQSNDVVIESLESKTSACNSAEPRATKKTKKSTQFLSYIFSSENETVDPFTGRGTYVWFPSIINSFKSVFCLYLTCFYAYWNSYWLG